MGMDVNLKLNDSILVQLAAARRRGLVKAGMEILKASNERAPFEEKAKHGVHLRDTGGVRLEVGRGDGDRVAIFYEAFWAVWQHEKMEWHHEHGEAKFLELALIVMEKLALEIVAQEMRDLAS